MSMNKYLALIDSYLNKRISFNEFSSHIESLYSSSLEYDSYPENITDFIENVYEKSTYASENLAKNNHDRGYGLIDSNEYYEWLEKMKQDNIHLWKMYG